MVTQLELHSRAALCRQLAQREPESRAYWLAEAEKWLRLCRDPIHQQPSGEQDPLLQFPDLMDERSGR